MILPYWAPGFLGGCRSGVYGQLSSCITDKSINQSINQTSEFSNIPSFFLSPSHPFLPSLQPPVFSPQSPCLVTDDSTFAISAQGYFPPSRIRRLSYRFSISRDFQVLARLPRSDIDCGSPRSYARGNSLGWLAIMSFDRIQ